MAHGPTKYQTKGVCIYCGKKGVLLTDEHVVPLFIGGKHVIEKASCVVCATITARFELDVVRGLWGDARASHKAPTRRKKEQAKSFLLKDPKGLSADLEISADQYPAPWIFYYMATAGILAGSDRRTDLSAKWVLKAIVDDKRLKEFEAMHPGRLTAKFKNVPGSFGRVLAKIGHCQVLTALDPGDFAPICLPYVLGKKSNVSYVVGSSTTNFPPQLDTGYSIRTVVVSSGERMLLVAEVRLLANCDTPTYHIVVGEVIGNENLQRVTAKLFGSEPVMERHFDSQTAPDNGFPWIPQVWPITA